MDESLEKLSEVGLRVSVNTVLTPYNSEVQEVRQLLMELAEYRCVDRVSLTPAGFSLYREDTQYLPALASVLAVRDMVNEEFAGKVGNMFVRVAAYAEKPPKSCEDRAAVYANRAYCTANTRNIVVLPDGRVTICEELYDHPAFIIGDLQTQSIEEVWKSEKALALFARKQSDFSLGSACRECSDFDGCRSGKGVCYKNVLKAYGNENWDFPDPSCPRAEAPYRQYWHS